MENIHLKKQLNEKKIRKLLLPEFVFKTKRQQIQENRKKKQQKTRKCQKTKKYKLSSYCIEFFTFIFLSFILISSFFLYQMNIKGRQCERC